MLLWAGIGFILLGLASIAFDRRSSHALYDRVTIGFWRFLDSTTHLAKASHWLIAAAVGYGVAVYAGWHEMRDCALAFIESLVAGSIVLHAIKLVVGRR